MDPNQPQQSAPPQSPPQAPMSNSTIFSILAYLGPLIIVSYLMGKDDQFVKYHIKQGLVLVIIEIGIWVLSGFFWGFWMIWQLVNLAVLVLAIFGIVNAVNHKEAELPVVGSFAKNFNI